MITGASQDALVGSFEPIRPASFTLTAVSCVNPIAQLRVNSPVPPTPAVRVVYEDSLAWLAVARDTLTSEKVYPSAVARNAISRHWQLGLEVSEIQSRCAGVSGAMRRMDGRS